MTPWGFSVGDNDVENERWSQVFRDFPSAGSYDRPVSPSGTVLQVTGEKDSPTRLLDEIHIAS
jgi:hypothetical protein